MESEITENAIGIAYSLVNTCLSQLCECYYIAKPPHSDIIFTQKKINRYYTLSFISTTKQGNSKQT